MEGVKHKQRGLGFESQGLKNRFTRNRLERFSMFHEVEGFVTLIISVEQCDIFHKYNEVIAFQIDDVISKHYNYIECMNLSVSIY